MGYYLIFYFFGEKMKGIKNLAVFFISYIISFNILAEDLSSMQGASSQILMLVIFIATFYFLIWRPNAKRNQDHKKLIENLSKGDEILTSGGILGKVSKIEKSFIYLEISNNVSITIQKQYIVKAYPKGTITSI